MVDDPFSVGLGLLGVEPAGEGLAGQFAGVLVVGAVSHWGVDVAAAAGAGADGVAGDHAARGDEAQLADLFLQAPIAGV